MVSHLLVRSNCALFELPFVGSNVTGEGHRLLRAGASELRGKMSVLAERIRALEGALKVAHGHYSTTPHRLLSEELIAIARVRETLHTIPPSTSLSPLLDKSAASTDKDEDENALVDALGSLSITAGGNSRYVGPNASSWRFLVNGIHDDHLIAHRARLRTAFPPALLATFGICSLAVQTYPYVERHDSRLLELRAHLPLPVDLAPLADSYYDHAAVLFVFVLVFQLFRLIDNLLAIQLSLVTSSQPFVLHATESAQGVWRNRLSISASPRFLHCAQSVLCCLHRFLPTVKPPRVGLRFLVQPFSLDTQPNIQRLKV
jgi:hypothetical protein